MSGEAPDAQSALELLKKLKPDLAIVDILQGIDGIELTKTTGSYGNLPVLVVSMQRRITVCRTRFTGRSAWIHYETGSDRENDGGNSPGDKR